MADGACRRLDSRVVVALVIAGVDVVETSFLLLVASRSAR